MNLIKIGAFIKSCRKNKSLTQEELSEKINVSQKTVSKWECGKGLPDVSIMLDLCSVLSISVNELLNGERIDSVDYMDKAEKKLLEMQSEKTKSDKRLLTAEIFIGVISSLVFVACALAFGFLMERSEVLYAILFLVLGFVVFIPCITFCLYIEQKAGYYKCGKCGHKFVPSFLQITFSLHFGRSRIMKCPNCGKRSYCKKVVE